ncbi:MAG: outer membrane protein assembly factor BamD [Gemmatimonadota bacterium]
MLMGGLLPAMLMTACASSGPDLQGLDADALYQVGERALAERQWDEAVRAFERFVVSHTSDDRYQEARYRLGEAYFGDGEYVSAAAEFNRLAQDYPGSEWADDARFQVCRSYERLSPPVELDQQYTYSAIEHCASLVQYFPNSEFVPRAREIITALRNKLGTKVYEAGEWYRGRDLIDSAIIQYQMVLEEYPDTDAAPRALLRLHESYRELGYDEEAIAARARLLADYPDSAEARGLGGGGTGTAP